MLELEFTNETDDKIDEGIFLGVLERACDILNPKEGSISLILVGDDKMAELNEKYRSRQGSTDVLSFSYLENDDMVDVSEKACAGEIFICVDKARQQSTERGHSLDKEVKTLFAHGLLHVFGYTHDNDKDEKIMDELTEKIIS